MADNEDACHSSKMCHLSYRPDPYEDSADSDPEVDVEGCSRDKTAPGGESAMDIKLSCCGNLVREEREDACAKWKLDHADTKCSKESSFYGVVKDGNLSDEKETTAPEFTKCCEHMNPKLALQRQSTSVAASSDQKLQKNQKRKDRSALYKDHCSSNRDKSCSCAVSVRKDHNESVSMMTLNNSACALGTENFDNCGSLIETDTDMTDISAEQANALKTRRETCFRSDASNEDSDESVEVYEADSKSKKCPLKGCGKVFGRPSRLAQHLRIHAGERPFECPIEGCSKSYTRQQHLKRHVVTHHTGKTEEPKKLECDKCGRVFINMYNLKKHHQRYHVQQRFTCGECGKIFKKQQHLKTHSFVHTGIKPYACEYPGCDTRCETPSRLKRHCLKHEGSRYVCPRDECNQTFDQYKELRYHLSISHPKVCDVCSRTFRQLRQLKKHRLTHENIVEAYFCPVVACDKYYYQANNLRTHIREKHEQLQIYECGVCRKRLSTKQKLINHMTLHEPNYKRNYVSKNPRKPRKDKGAIRRDLPRLLSGYNSEDEDDDMKANDQGEGSSGGPGSGTSNRNGSQGSSCSTEECGRNDGDTDIAGGTHCQGKGNFSFQDDDFDHGDESNDGKKSECSGDSGYGNGNDVVEERNFTVLDDMEVEMGLGSQS